MMEEMLGWQWHQLDHMKIICNLFLTDIHTSTASLNYYGLDALPATQQKVSKD